VVEEDAESFSCAVYVFLTVCSGGGGGLT